MMSTISKFKGRVVCTKEQFDNLEEKDPNKEYLVTDDDTFAKTNENNSFSGHNTFNENTQFDKGLSSDGDISSTNGVFKVLDSTLVGDEQKDIVTQYSADNIVKEENGVTHTYKFPNESGEFVVKNEISYLTYAPYIELTPNSATNGNLSEDIFDVLTEHDEIGIKLNGEYYDIADDQTTPGIRSYVHKGWNGNSEQIKSINITLSTKAWTLVIGTNNNFEHIIKVNGSNGDGGDEYEFMFIFNSSKSAKVTTQNELTNLIGEKTIPVSGYRKVGSIYYQILYLKGTAYCYLNNTSGKMWGGIASLSSYSIEDIVQ